MIEVNTVKCHHICLKFHLTKCCLVTYYKDFLVAYPNNRNNSFLA